MTGTQDVRLASTIDEVPASLGTALARAFAEDPGAAYLWPDPPTRHASLRWYYGDFVPRLGLAFGRTYTAGAGGVSVWVRPGEAVGLGAALRHGVWRLPLRYGLGAASRLHTLSDVIEGLRRRAAPEGHWYLLLLGVAPEAQGRGLARRLLRPVLDDARLADRPVYLETSNPANLAIYDRLGFGVVGEAVVPGGPTFWGLARAAEQCVRREQERERQSGP